jgi:hypothetical protein
MKDLIELHINSLKSTDNTVVLSEQDVNTLLSNGKQSLESGVVNFTKLLNNDTVELTKYPIVKETLSNYQDTVRLIRTLTNYISFDAGYMAYTDLI